MKRFILPAGLTLAFLAALTCPDAGVWLARYRLAFVFVAVMFFINGYQTDMRVFSISRRFIGGIIIGAAVSFIGGAVIGKAIASLLHFPSEITTGLIIMCIMAPTLSTVIVITKESGGNTLWALLMTVGLNLLSIAVIPPVLSLLISGNGVPIPSASLLIDLLRSVLAPFIAGSIVRHFLKKEPHTAVNFIPTLLIITLSYMSFSSGRSTILAAGGATNAVLAATVVGIHLTLFFAALFIATLFRYSIADKKAIAFIGSQKTLPTAMAIVTSLGFAGGAAAVPCVLFHFCQIIIDSLIAVLWKKRTI